MTSPAKPSFSWSDAWLLQAISAASLHRPATLKEVIAMGDALEKAVFSFEELSSGLAKLESAGYVRIVPEGFELQPALAKEFGAAAVRGDREVRSWFERFLDATPWSMQAEREGPDPFWRYPGLTKEAVDAAFGEYQTDVAAWLKNLGLPGA